MRTVVVGAGVGGLAAAVRLAATGHEVTVFEQADRVGGKLGSLSHQGFRFDTGPSLLTLPEVFADLIPDLADHLVRLDPVVRHVFPDGTILDSTSDSAAMTAAVRNALGDKAAGDWSRVWDRAGRIWEASWRHVLRNPHPAPWRQAWRLRDLAAIRPGSTLRAATRGLDPRLRMLLDRYATYTGSDPRRAPAALLAIPYAELTHGGWYVRGGLARIADLLHDRARALDATVHTAMPVAGIITGSGRVRGVRLADGSQVPADAVVANADALSVYRDLLPTPPRAHRLAARSLSGFVLLLGLRGRTPGLAHHTVWFPADYDAEFDSAFTGRLVDDPAVYVSVADDPAVRPDGHEAWFVLVNAPPQGPVDWRAPGLAQGYADRVLDTLAARGVDVRDRVVFREVLTPADLEARTLTPGGAIYGTPSHGPRGLLRPPNRGPVAGLYLVGGSVHPGGGLPLVALSAEIVAATIGPAVASRRGCPSSD
jgi:phytoene desaturase